MRVSVEELSGLSEYQLDAATPADTDDQTAELPPSPRGGPPRRESLSVAPEELGQHFLEEAVQDPRPLEEEPKAPESGRNDVQVPVEPRERRKPRARLQPIEPVLNRSEIERERSRRARDAIHQDKSTNGRSR